MKKLIVLALFTTMLGGIAGYTISYLIEPRFKSKAVLLVKDSGNASLGNLGGLSNLAGLAGINMAGSATDFSLLFKEYASAHFLLKEYVDENWELILKNEFSGSEHIHEVEQNELKEKYIQDLEDTYFDVNLESNNKIIEISILSKSPQYAQIQLTNLIRIIDDKIRTDEALQSQLRIEKIKELFESENIKEVRSRYISMIEEETLKAINLKIDDYAAVRLLDPPTLPYRKALPKRSLYALIGAMAFFLSVSFFIFMKLRIKS